MITDLTLYRKHVVQFDLNEKEKIELVNAFWMIVDNMLDNHFGLNRLPSEESLSESNCKKRAKTKGKSQSLSKSKQARQCKRAIEAK